LFCSAFYSLLSPALGVRIFSLENILTPARFYSPSTPNLETQIICPEKSNYSRCPILYPQALKSATFGVKTYFSRRAGKAEIRRPGAKGVTVRPGATPRYTVLRLSQTAWLCALPFDKLPIVGQHGELCAAIIPDRMAVCAAIRQITDRWSAR